MLRQITIAALFAGMIAKAQAAEAEKPTLDGSVLVGKGDNYESWVTQFDNVMIEFYAPWCGHCKQLEPEYEKAAKQLHDESIEVPLVKVDATDKENEEHAKKYEIQGFPTIKWFTNGSPSDYDGGRTGEAIVQWIKDMTGPAVELEAAPTGEESLAVIQYGEEMSEVFEGVAKANRKAAKWFFVKSSESKTVLKHKGEAEISTDTLEKDSLESFVKDNSLPKFGELNGETFGSYMENGNGLIWTLFKMEPGKESETIEENRAAFVEVAEKINAGEAKEGETKQKWNLTWTNTVQFTKELEGMFGITEFPRLIVQKKAGDKKSFIYDGEMTAEKVAEYIAKVEAGEVQVHLKSEPVPEDQSAEPVKTIVGKTMQDMVFTEDKDVLLEVYAPWCGHCKKLEPEYLKVGKKVIKEGFDNILTIAKMDGTLNDSTSDEIEWSGFPTIIYVKARGSDETNDGADNEVVKFDGGRDAKGIWKWIKKNHSQADKIKEAIKAKKEAKESEESTETTEEKAEEPAKEAKEEL